LAQSARNLRTSTPNAFAPPPTNCRDDRGCRSGQQESFMSPLERAVRGSRGRGMMRRRGP
jgi:hypothetical protein